VAVTVLLVGLIGFARVYLGVHSVSDVVLGFAAGVVWLATCILAYPRIVDIVDSGSAPQTSTLRATPL
jgi:membrane-associated phospholipid phosphatase